MVVEKKPKDVFQMYERMHFFYEQRDDQGFDIVVCVMKEELGKNAGPRFRQLFRDISILLEGDDSNPVIRTAGLP